MARPLRVEFDWALHPVINLGELRADGLASKAPREAFELCLREGYEKSRWQLDVLER